MKTTLTFSLIGLFLAATVVGCSDSAKNSLTAPPVAADQTSRFTLPSGVLFTPSATNMVKLPTPKGTKGTTTATALITHALGGKVSLTVKYYDVKDKVVTIAMDMKFAPGVVSEDTWIKMTLDETVLGSAVSFSPAMTFNSPALLNVSATGIDLEGFTNGTVDLWYVVGDVWTSRQQARSIVINSIKGTLDAKDVQIPHFSRYAFGRLADM